MQPFSRPVMVSCPRCSSPAVRVPWDLQAARHRRALIRLALALWITYAPWLAAGLVLDAAPLWLTPLAVYGAATLWLAARLWLSLRTYRCTECGLTWRGGKAVS